jgi:hypothetical protein
VHHVTKARNSFRPVLPEVSVDAWVGDAVAEHGYGGNLYPRAGMGLPVGMGCLRGHGFGMAKPGGFLPVASFRLGVEQRLHPEVRQHLPRVAVEEEPLAPIHTHEKDVALSHFSNIFRTCPFLLHCSQHVALLDRA